MSTWRKLTQAISQLTGDNVVRKPPSAAAATDLPGTEKREDDTLLTDEARIVEMLMHVVDSNLQVQLAFGSKIIVYTAHFLPEQATDASGGSEPSSEYLQKKSHIRMGPTEPLEGITKLQNGQSATCSLVYGNKFNEFETHLIVSNLHGLVVVAGKGESQPTIGQSPPLPTPLPNRPDTTPPPTPPIEGAENMTAVEAAPSYQISFPDKIFRKPQRRTTVRIKNSEDARVSLSIRREAGISFFAPIVDIGVGGVCFMLPEEEAPISEESELELIFYWDEEGEVTCKGSLVKMGVRQGKNVGQIAFSPDSYVVVRALGELVAYIERTRLQSRERG